MNGESYEKSIAKLALQSIPTTRSARGGSLAPEFTPPIEQGPAELWARLNESQVRAWEEPEDPAEKAWRFVEENLGATGGMTKLGAASRVARQLLPYAEKASGETLSRLGGIWRSTLEIPRREYQRVFDIEVLNELPGQKIGGVQTSSPRGRLLFPKETPEGRKPTAQVSASEGWWQTLWHEIAGHARQMLPEFRGTKDFKLGKYNLSEADVSDLLWRIRHKMVENEAWSVTFDPLEVHARKVPERLPGLRGENYDFNYDLTLVETLNQAKRDWPKYFEESLGELVSEYPSKVWPIAPD